MYFKNWEVWHLLIRLLYLFEDFVAPYGLQASMSAPVKIAIWDFNRNFISPEDHFE